MNKLTLVGLPHQIESPQTALEYIAGGQGKLTLVGHQTRYTFKFGHPDDSQFPIFVKLLTGPDNNSDYQYIGHITNRYGPYSEMRAGRKGNSNHPAFKALAWYLDKAQLKPEVANQAEVWHEGVCGRCGRVLTVPASIEAGMGPSCAQKTLQPLSDIDATQPGLFS